MYKKMKYMLYVSLFLILAFMTTAVLIQNQNAKRKDQKQESQEFEQVKEMIYNQSQVNQNKEIINQPQIVNSENTFEDDSKQLEYIDTIDEIKKSDTDTDSLESKKTEQEESSYIIESDAFAKIDTETDSPVMSKYLDYTAIVTNLTSSSVLFFVFNKDLKVIWQTKITNSTNSIEPDSITIEENKVVLNLKEKDYNNTKSTGIEIEVKEAANNNLNLKLKNINDSEPEILNYSSKTPAIGYKYVDKIKNYGSNYFYIIAQQQTINNSSKTVFTKFYVYKEENGYLKKVYNLFERRINKEDNPVKYIQVKIVNNILYATFNNGQGNRKIPVSHLNNQNTNTTGEYLCIGTKTKVEDSNIQIKIKNKAELKSTER